MSERRIIVTADHPMRRQVLRDRGFEKTTGTVYYAECGLCGLVEWSLSTEQGNPELLVAVIQNREPRECRRCNEVFTRAPEVAQWVQGAVNKLGSELHERIKALEDKS